MYCLYQVGISVDESLPGGRKPLNSRELYTCLACQPIIYLQVGRVIDPSGASLIHGAEDAPAAAIQNMGVYHRCARIAPGLYLHRSQRMRARILTARLNYDI
jgi:hypothetical protein